MRIVVDDEAPIEVSASSMYARTRISSRLSVPMNRSQTGLSVGVPGRLKPWRIAFSANMSSYARAGVLAAAIRVGIVIANPIPEADAMPRATIDAWIAQALVEAAQAGIVRKAVTPFLLTRINELSGGASLRANVALVKNNAVLAAQIAVERARHA